MISTMLLILAVIYVLIKVLLVVQRRKKLPPGPVIWPIIGNAIELRLADADYPHLALAKLAKKYGNIMGIGFGSTYSVVISGFDELRVIFKKSETCEARFEFPYVRDRSFNKSLGIIWSSGDLWRTMRRFTIKNLRDFGFGKRKSMEKLIKEETDAVLADIREETAKDAIWEVNPHYLSTAVLNVLWTMIGGDRFDHKDEKLLENLRLNDEFAKIIGHNNITNIFPALKRWFPRLVNHPAHMKVHSRIQQWLKGLIEETKIKRSQRSDPRAQSFIEVFVDEIEKSAVDRNTYFTEEQLIVTLLDLFFAGAETTSMTLNWAILFLTLNPDVQRTLQEEIQEAFEKSPNLSIYEAERLPYLRAVLLEVSRLGNVGPVPLPRLVTADIYYKHFTIPKDTCLYANLVPVFMDEEFWGDPEEFRPDRFLYMDGEIIPQVEERIAIFGFGTRMCIGETMAWDTMTFFLIELLRNFTFLPIPGKEPSAEKPIAALTIKPRLYSVRAVPNRV